MNGWRAFSVYVSALNVGVAVWCAVHGFAAAAGLNAGAAALGRDA